MTTYRWAVVYQGEPCGRLCEDKDEAIDSMQDVRAHFVAVSRRDGGSTGSQWCVDTFDNAWRIGRFKLVECKEGEGE